jgi:hypothetical protein
MADFGLNGCFGGFGENLGCWDASRNRGTLKYLDNINLSDDPFVGSIIVREESSLMRIMTPTI